MSWGSFNFVTSSNHVCCQWTNVTVHGRVAATDNTLECIIMHSPLCLHHYFYPTLGLDFCQTSLSLMDGGLAVGNMENNVPSRDSTFPGNYIYRSNENGDVFFWLILWIKYFSKSTCTAQPCSELNTLPTKAEDRSLWSFYWNQVGNCKIIIG